LQKAYQVLSDPKKRERYEQWGDDGTDTFNSTEWMNAYEYYRALNPEIEKTDYKNYIAGYVGSEEEETDLINFYEEFGGDMKGILEHIIASNNDSVPRFLEFYEAQFNKGELEKTKLYDSTKGKIKLLADEKAEAKKQKQKIK